MPPPPKKNVSMKPSRFREGDAVCWKGDDPDIPRRTVGVVKSIHDDGDIEVLFPAPGGSQMFTFHDHRLARAFGKGDEVHLPSNLVMLLLATNI